jgi:hypothetical protein
MHVLLLILTESLYVGIPDLLGADSFIANLPCLDWDQTFFSIWTRWVRIRNQKLIEVQRYYKSSVSMCECDLQEKYNHIPCIDVAITLSS